MIFFILGVLDTCSWIFFIINFDVIKYYNILIVLKLSFFLWQRHIYLDSIKPFLLFAVISIVVTGLSYLNAQTAIETPYLKVIGFFVSLFLTIQLTASDTNNSYFSGAMASLVLCVCIFLSFYLLGFLETRFGRYLFFGGSHPNLGGEYFAAGAMCLGLKRLSLLKVFFYCFFAFGSYLLQARASFLTICLLLFCVFLFKSRSYLLPVNIVCSFLLCFLVFLNFDALMGSDDAYRGNESGLSGRTEIYKEAIASLKKNPFLGVGYGYFDGERREAVHNFFLQGFAENGVFFILILLCLASRLFSLFGSNLFLFYMVLCFSLMVFLNARFFNLNPFPFLLYFILFKKEKTIF